MIKRKINELEIEVNEYEANELYFPECFVENAEGIYEGDIEKIKKSIYAWNGNVTYVPVSILWEITNKCNFGCPFCYVNNEDAKRYPSRNFEYYKRIIDDLVNRGMLFCCLTGGECLLHSHFGEIYTYLKKAGVLVTVFTNGFEVSTEIVELFAAYKPYKVEISIYGMSEQTFANTTKCVKAGGYVRVLDNILELKKNGINVRCKTPVNSFTEGDVDEINQWCEKNNIDYYTSEELLPTYSGKMHNEYLASEDILRKYEERKRTRLRKRRDFQHNYKKAWDCSAGTYAGVIAADGCFYPCMSCVGLDKFRYPFEDVIDVAIDMHIDTLQANRNQQLCDGCEWCNICEHCVVMKEKETVVDFMENCKQIRMI